MKKLILAAIGLLASALGTAQASTPTSVTQYSYNSLGRVQCVATRMNPALYQSTALNATDACTAATEGTYGPDRIVRSTYDPAGQLLKVEQGVGTSDLRTYATYTYTTNGLKKTELDANNNLTTIQYDGFDRVIKVIYPSSTLGAQAPNALDYEALTYDSAGNVLTQRRRNGAVVTFSYDALNRQTKKDVPAYNGLSATAYDVYTTYGVGGQVLSRNLTSATGPGVSYAYDGLGRVTSTTDQENRTLAYQYNIINARTRLTYPKKTAAGTDADYVTYTPDNIGRISSATYTSGTTVSAIFSQTFDSMGRRVALSRGAAVAGCSNAACATTYSFDNSGRLMSFNINLANTANDIGWTFGSQTVADPGYNPAGQIVRWSATSTFYDHKFQTGANRSFNGLNQETALVGVTAACPAGGFDASGNLICDGNRTLVYDAENHLLSVVNLSNDRKTTLSYDAEGRLQKKVVTVNSTGVSVSDERYLYDGVNVVADYSSSGTQLNRYVFGAGTDEPLGWFTGTTVANPRFFVANYQGSVIGYTDSVGNLAEYYTYSPYGEMAVGQGSSATTALSWTGASKFRYTGQIGLAEAQLYFYKARAYDPVMGRFMQTDPIGSKDDLDLYAYVGGDPINRSDSTGLEAHTDGNIYYVNPEDKSVPSVSVRIPAQRKMPQTVPNKAFFHTYKVMTPVLIGMGQELMSKFGIATRDNPTPGNADHSALPYGTLNNANAGGLMPAYVISYFIPSPDPSKYSDIVMNVTTWGHPLEGFALKYTEMLPDGTLVQISYGEGNDLIQGKNFGLGAVSDAVLNVPIWERHHDQIETQVEKSQR